MADGSMFEVDTGELRTAGSGMLRTGDAVHATAGAGVLLGNGAYGGSPLSPAAGRLGCDARRAYLRASCSGRMSACTANRTSPGLAHDP